MYYDMLCIYNSNRPGIWTADDPLGSQLFSTHGYFIGLLLSSIMWISADDFCDRIRICSVHRWES